MKHIGDITKINGAEVPIVDIICGGSPCQDLSVAGKREGLSGARSGLFMEQIRVIKEMRDECIRQLRVRGAAYDVRSIRPRFMVWENVPGAFSSNKGQDFRAVLEETARLVDQNAVIPMPEGRRWTPSGCIVGDGWSIAWRVHDAQFWGVPQRRKRISLVADFAGQSAPEILFERKGLSGDITTGGEKGQGTATTPKTDLRETISFQERAGCDGGAKGYSYNITEQEHCQPSTTKQSCNSSGDDIAGTLDANYYKGCGLRQGIEREVVCIGNGQVDQAKESKVVGALNCMHDQQAIITYGLDRASFNQGENAQYDFKVEKELSQTGVARGWGGGVLTHK